MVYRNPGELDDPGREEPDLGANHRAGTSLEPLPGVALAPMVVGTRATLLPVEAFSSNPPAPLAPPPVHKKRPVVHRAAPPAPIAAPPPAAAARDTYVIPPRMVTIVVHMRPDVIDWRARAFGWEAGS